MLSEEVFKHLGITEDSLKHYGIKGMRWGVKRNRNRPGGADGKEESTKVTDKRGTIRKNLDSMKRERDWNKVLKQVHELNTKDINAVTNRIRLENNLKTLSRSKVGTKKDKEDYLRREFMSDSELSRKVVRLRAKDNLRRAVKDASKEQRDFGEKVARIGGSIGVKLAINKGKIQPQDIFDAVSDPKKASDRAKQDLYDQYPKQKDILKTVIDKVDKPNN